jgi:hypothetical protein
MAFVMSETEQPQPDARKKASAGQVAKAVFWSFFGVRRSRDHDRDAVSITPLQVVVAGVIGAAVFVVCLIIIVQMVTR